ncbi:MAG: anthranilate phosphoribosyltransferase [Chitinophagaceae bacterium]|nr:anthranilate phosphoribosyltransferase [Chitinophagaceae bacterium]
MKKTLTSLFQYKTLSREEAKNILLQIAGGQFSEHEVSAFITVFLMRSITIEELLGFREALLQLCIRPELGDVETLDIVGTGGDGKNTFNISTLACFIAAGAGQKVAKHGNYGATSVSGASNVMEQLGYRFSNDSEKLKKELEQANICFLHAPLFHPALKAVAPIRKNLGIRTFFNMLGPVANPSGPKWQLVGVYNQEMARIYTYLFQHLEKPFTIIHTLDGYDEISLTAEAKVITQTGERVYSPEALGKRMVLSSDLNAGTTPEEAASLFLKILKGEGTWAQNAVVIANAAMGLFCTGKYANYEEAYHAALTSLESGSALRCFEQLIQLQ